MDNIPKYIIVHHSAAASPKPQFEAINKWHEQRGFPISSLGFYAGYHVVIEHDGTVVRAREDLERDCDALGHNFDSLSLCLVGNFDTTWPSAAQVESMCKVLAEWCDKFDILPDQIHPHRKFANKSCYGAKLADNWAAFNYMVYRFKEVAHLLKQTKPV